jgi:hypothetical protein
MMGIDAKKENRTAKEVDLSCPVLSMPQRFFTECYAPAALPRFPCAAPGFSTTFVHPLSRASKCLYASAASSRLAKEIAGFNVSVYSLPETDNASRINNTNPMSPLG